jgi:ubiquinone biosynthesis protein UbiJ
VREQINGLVRGTTTEQAETMNNLKGKVLRVDVGNQACDWIIAPTSKVRVVDDTEGNMQRLVSFGCPVSISVLLLT